MLKHAIEKRILSNGPMPLNQYLSLCLTDPQHGYYMKKKLMKKGENFITAPELTPMFGEMIGRWVVDVWQQMGRPQDLQLVEMGPGHGTLMLDILRMLKGFPGLPELKIHFLEISPAYLKIQQARLSGLPVHWWTTLEELLGDVKGHPTIFVANEFFNALPVQQFLRTSQGWRQMLVDIQDHRLALVPDIFPNCIAMPPYHHYPEGTIYEVCPSGLDIIHKVGQQVKTNGGGVLIIDCGYEYGVGETLQAIQDYAKVSIFDSPGNTDLAAQVRFSDLRHALESEGLKEVFYLTQQDFLKALGIESRAEALKALTTKAKQQAIDFAIDRLIGDQNSDYNKGLLFKVLGAVNLQVLS